eukprot:211158_1
MPLSDHFACLILASSSHVIYYEEGEMIKQYLIEHRDTSTSNAEQMRMMFNKWTSSQNYGDDYDGTIELSIPSSDFRYQMNYYTMNNITVAFIYHHTLRSTRHGTTRYKFMKRMNDNLVYIHQQIMTHLVDIHDIPLYIMRIRCRTIIQPIIQPLKRNECIQSCIDCCHCECDQDCLFCAFWVIFVIITGGLGLFCFLCYRYYWLEQQTGAALDQVQHDLDQALSESEVGFGSGLQGNQVGFNPLATGFNPNAPAGNGVPNRPPEHGGVGKDFIRPNVERPVFKQQYGPQEGNLGGGVDPNTDPELVMAVRLSLEEPRQSQAQAKKAAESPLGSTSSDEDIDGLIAAVLQDIEIQDAINEGREEGDSDHDDKTADTLDQTNHIQAPPDADDSNKNKPSQPPPQLPQPPPPPPPFIPEMKPRVIPSARPILMSSKSMEIGTKHDGMSWFNLRRHPSESAAVNAIVDKEKKRLVDTKIALTKISLILRDVDEDKNGFVDYEEFGEALRLIDSNINHIEIDQIYSHFVYNEDDELCIELFIDLVHQRCQRRSAVDVDHITPATVLQRSFEFIKSAINKIYDTLREKDEDNDFLIDWSEFEEAMIDLEVNASMTQTYLRSIYRII